MLRNKTESIGLWITRCKGQILRDFIGARVHMPHITWTGPLAYSLYVWFLGDNMSWILFIFFIDGGLCRVPEENNENGNSEETESILLKPWVIDLHVISAVWISRQTDYSTSGQRLRSWPNIDLWFRLRLTLSWSYIQRKMGLNQMSFVIGLCIGEQDVISPLFPPALTGDYWLTRHGLTTLKTQLTPSKQNVDL